MKRLLPILALLLLCDTTQAQDRVVLVVGAASPIDTLTAFEVRKLFLAIDVFKDGRMIRACRNTSDPRVNDVFLQSVVGLSQERYERRLLANAFQFGTTRPDEYADVTRLLEVLQANPYAVTYLLVDGELPTGVKVLRVLWQEF